MTGGRFVDSVVRDDKPSEICSEHRREFSEVTGID